MDRKFNIRVYALLIRDHAVLVTDEYRFGTFITKFPGGGLEFGEGTMDCVIRECREELEQEITVKSHFYTTDFFQLSAFNPNQQVISIYYLVDSVVPLRKAVTRKPFDFPVIAEGAQVFRWIDLSDISAGDFTFPIDKKVAEMLKKL